MTTQAVGFKQRYRLKWARANAREYYVANLLNTLFDLQGIPAVALIVGFGAGLDREKRGWHAGLGDKWDIVVVAPGYGLVGFVDVTGYESVSRAKGNADRCIGSHKLWEAEDRGVLDITWFAHLTDDTTALYFLRADIVSQRVEKKDYARKLYSDEKIYYCFPAKEWQKPASFISWTRRRVLNLMSQT